MKKYITYQVLKDGLIARCSRIFLSYQYVSGQGLEVGALHNPLMLPPWASVRYVDRMPEQQLRDLYPELKKRTFVPIDIIENGEMLLSVADGSLDFLIANHIIEHIENPLLALENWLRVLKKGGILYLAVPNKEKTFDRSRQITLIDHLVRDYHEGPGISRRTHYEEWAEMNGKMDPVALEHHITKLISTSYSIHYHVWDPPAFLSLLRHCQKERAYPMQIERNVSAGKEIIVILRKTA